MSKRSTRWLPLFALPLALCPLHLQAQELATETAVRNMTQMKFHPLPGLPTCLTGAVQHGNPANRPSYIFIRMDTGCAIPWHWHSANEMLMMVSGTGRIDMRDAKPQTIAPGAFALFAPHHVHQFRCAHRCTFYLHTDAAFDIHYVNHKEDGNGLTPDDALKAAGEIAAK